MKRECETCIKRKTPYCPTSIDCMATDDMPYYQNRIMLLEENEQLKKQLENINEQANYLRKSVERKEGTIIDLQNERVPYTNEYVAKLENQQKEFIDWLEDKIKFSTKPTTCVLLKSILQNYKEIIGNDINVGSNVGKYENDERND